MAPINISSILARSKVLYDDIIGQLIRSDEVGVSVKLYYPPTYVECSNCQLTQYGITYRAGGPAPFFLGNCPACGTNTCKKEVEVYDTIKLRVYSNYTTSFSRNIFKKVAESIDSPAGELLTIGFMTDLRKVKSCNYGVFYEEQEASFGSLRYNLAGEPRPHGFSKDTFFFCFWKRV